MLYASFLNEAKLFLISEFECDIYYVWPPEKKDFLSKQAICYEK